MDFRISFLLVIRQLYLRTLYLIIDTVQDRIRLLKDKQVFEELISICLCKHTDFIGEFANKKTLELREKTSEILGFQLHDLELLCHLLFECCVIRNLIHQEPLRLAIQMFN